MAWPIWRSGLGWWDICEVVAVLAVMLRVAWRRGRGQSVLEDFCLGGRSLPWWAAGCGFLAAEISVITVVGAPALSFRDNWNYAQFFFGSALARLAIAFVFIPALFQARCSTVYGFLRLRLGPGSQYAAAGLFFFARSAISGVRLLAAALAVSMLSGWPVGLVMVLFCVAAALYIGYGGLPAVVWTGVVQVAAVAAGGLAVLAFLLWRIDGGVSTIWELAGGAGRLDLLDWGPSWPAPGFWASFFFDPNTVWAAVLGGSVSSLAAFGADHEMMQKLMSTSTEQDSRRAVLYSILGSFVVMVLFLSIGSGIYTYYAANTGLVLPDKADKILQHFVLTEMPDGLRGLVLAAVIMAAIDLPLAAMAAVFVQDIYRPLIRPEADERHYMLAARWAVAGSALLLGLGAYYLSVFDSNIGLAFRIGGVALGPLLGVFLLCFRPGRSSDRSNVAAMLIMTGLCLGLLSLSEAWLLPLGWSWLVLFGTVGTAVLSDGLGRIAVFGAGGRG
ncbi:MAG: hypothetical protein WC881_00095 [Elusimicrobiota bacterium]|jgi:Na+/proline symporter